MRTQNYLLRIFNTLNVNQSAVSHGAQFNKQTHYATFISDGGRLQWQIFWISSKMQKSQLKTMHTFHGDTLLIRYVKVVSCSQLDDSITILLPCICGPGLLSDIMPFTGCKARISYNNAIFRVLKSKQRPHGRHMSVLYHISRCPLSRKAAFRLRLVI